MARAKKHHSKAIHKVESILKVPPKRVEKAVKKVKKVVTDHKKSCDDISSTLWIVEKNVFDQAREKVGNDLPKIREEILRMEKETQQNYGNITSEIDKYNKISE
jgi:hypothetical protein